MIRRLFSPLALSALILFPFGSFAAKEKVLVTGYHTFPNALPGKTFTSKKILDTTTGQIRYVSDYPEISTPEALSKLMLEDKRLEDKQFGVLNGRLRSKFNEMKEEDRVRVIVILKYPDGIAHPSKLENASDVLERHSRQIADLQPVVSLNDFFLRYGMGAPILLGKRAGLYEMPKYKLKEIMFDKDVSDIVEFIENEPAIGRISIAPLLFGQVSPPDYSVLSRSAYNHNNNALPAGAGNLVKAATFEIGLEQSILNCWSITPIVWEANAGYDHFNWVHHHSLQTFRAMALAAPNARFYHRASPSYSLETNWIQSNGIQTSSLSYARGNTYPWGPTDPEFREMDDFAYKFPYTLFFTPTANAGWTQEANWQGYNAMSVGNVLHHRQNTFMISPCTAPGGTIAGCTQTRNPVQRYGGPCLRAADGTYNYCSSDREMPQIVAPGYSPELDLSTCALTTMRDGCVPNSDGDLTCGTSFSAPTANGIAADVIAADSRMVSWPEKVRAALLVTAENVDAGEWSLSVDGRDGAGVINGASAVNFAQTHTAIGPSQGAVVKGLGIGQISSSNWYNTLQYNIAVPNPVPSGKYLRIVLTWDSNVSLNNPVNALSDLDISASSPLATKTSTSFNSNIEIVYFTPGQVQAGGSVTATINKAVNYIPSNATTNYFYYAIAWDWVDQHAP